MANNNIKQDLGLQLDPGADVSLFRQLAAGVRYQIQTGALAPGDRLPTMREAGDALGVSIHTVRRAYQLLEVEGLLDLTRGRGTRVRDLAADEGTLEAELRDFLQLAEERFAVSDVELLARLEALVKPEGDGGGGGSWVVECSATLSRLLADQLRGHGARPVRPWTIGELASLPPGPVVATYFHYARVREALAERILRDQVHFVAIQPDPDALRALLGAEDRPLLFCDADPPGAHSLLLDIRRVLGPARPYSLTTPEQVEERLDREPDAELLCSPGAWEAVGDAVRKRSATYLLPIRVHPDHVDALAAFLTRSDRRQNHVR